MREALEAWFGILIGFAVFGTLFSGILIWLGAKAVRIQNSRPRSILFAALCASTLVTFGTFIMSGLPFLGSIPSALIAFLLTFFPIKIILKANRIQSLVLWTLNCAGLMLALFLGAALFTGGLRDFLTLI